MGKVEKLVALTDAKLKVLKPKHARYTVGDSRGLAIEVFPTGGMGWRFRYQLNGRTEKVTLGKYPDVSLKLARQKRDAFATAVAKGESPARTKQLIKAGGEDAALLCRFGDRYYREVIEKSRRHPMATRSRLDNQIYPTLGHKSLDRITALEVQTLIFRKRDEGYIAAAGELRALLFGIFEYAIVCGLTSVNPVRATPMRFVFRPKPRTRNLSPKEIAIFLKKLYGSKTRRQLQIALHLILLTLVRKSELRLAYWRDVHLEKGEWHIPQEQSKTGKPHIVYLSRRAISLFEQLRAFSGSSDLVLPGRASLKVPFSPSVFNEMLESIDFGIPPFTPHDLRRTGSTLLHEMGYSSDVVEKSLNHTIGGIRGVYNKAEYAEQRKEMLQKWADYVDDLTSQV
jgi:integrase